MRLGLLALLAGCAGKDGAAGVHWGDVTALRAGEHAVVEGRAAFGFDSASNGKALLYVTSNADATCDDATNGLSGNTSTFDPTRVLPAGTCSVFVYLDYDGASASVASPSAAATLALNCAMDEGEWVDAGEGDGDLVYSGPYWQGSPGEFDVTVSGGEGAAFALDLSMGAFDGTFIYESSDDAPADGEAAGSISAEWCEGFGQTTFF